MTPVRLFFHVGVGFVSVFPKKQLFNVFVKTYKKLRAQNKIRPNLSI